MDELEKHLERIKRARESKSSIPGPQEARECMLELEKVHTLARRNKLRVF